MENRSILHPLQRLGSSLNSGRSTGIYSVCSAHPIVLEAAVRQAVEDGTVLLVEATSNQVNQFGGYTGMRPADFRDFVFQIAARHGLIEKNLILGGDHLGPNPWQHLPAEEAMQHAEDMVAEYSRAGFVKIHLDASMPCIDDEAALSDEVVAERASRLCRIAEKVSCGDERFYIIGTEVPKPGGALESLKELAITSYEDAARTLDIHRKVFIGAGLGAVWPRVIALVVQPGVEFNHDSVVNYDAQSAKSLCKLLRESRGLVFEAHSTDYQVPEAYKALVDDGFAILKVGPALTFAMREALFSLARIEEEIVPAEKCSRLPEVMEEVMLARPKYWDKHYRGDAREQHVLRRFSYSDRIRYYWPEPEIQSAVDTLLQNLEQTSIPETLLSGILPEQYRLVRSGRLQLSARELVVEQVRQALRPYAAACRN
jgi:D-tagatose-1,6-bisphosphate aldolase subunit GatZ/KbaZ